MNPKKRKQKVVYLDMTITCYRQRDQSHYQTNPTQHVCVLNKPGFNTIFFSDLIHDIQLIVVGVFLENVAICLVLKRKSKR